MKALGLGVLTGVLVATVAASLVFALTDQPQARALYVDEPSGQAAAPRKTQATEDPTTDKADFAGRVAGGLVALSIRGGKAVGYFCDGRREVWMSGDARDNRATLTGTEDGETLMTAELGDDDATGDLVLGEAAFRFTAPVVERPSGLYRATEQVRGASVVGGWIVLPGGRQVGAVRFGDAEQPAPRLVPGRDVRIGGVTLEPEPVDAFIEELTHG
ncbi:hypothetical protein FXF51_06985 [Nonomuraea sp. PA05]|uniref:hypothetical protein n=1 Tax=Nonomuraea sp. PA05 TaxID=2604466 RepID=UPI0011D44C05|nr:hypothetical protein [Nonomuraea sp. PA05]TYB69892.1 hypothetical protein FXF51_06985 [Nonomuraea sp. PA05]